ncbi:hypothetical protein CRUP_010723, partial [Coryphaenoides rupestris]
RQELRELRLLQKEEHRAQAAKKKYFDTELEVLEKNQKQTIEKMETDHSSRLRDETKRIKNEQDRELHRFQEQLKHSKK